MLDKFAAEFGTRRPYFVYPEKPMQPTEPQAQAAIYARVSTHKQDYALQVTELKGYSYRSNYAVEEYFEHGSGKAGARRAELARLMADARLKKFSVVVVWKLDRFGRSLSELLNNIRTLDELGIRFISLTDGIDTDKNTATGRLLLQIMGAFAEFERSIIVERVRAGVQEAKRQGKHCGRPGKIFRRDEAVRLRAAGQSWREISRTLKVPQATVRRAVAGLRK